MEPSSPLDVKPKITQEERDSLQLLIRNVGQIFPPKRFTPLIVAAMIYVERIEGRAHMKEGVNMTCSVFVGGVMLASRVGLRPLSPSPYATLTHPPLIDHAR